MGTVLLQHIIHKTSNLITGISTYAAKVIIFHAYPVGATTPTFEDNQGTIKAICASRIHDNTRYLATKISCLNEQYIDGIIKLLYAKMTLQLSDINTKLLCGKYLQAMIAYLIGIRVYPLLDTKHHEAPQVPVAGLLSTPEGLSSHQQAYPIFDAIQFMSGYFICRSFSILYIPSFHLLYFVNNFSFKALPLMVLE
jgi:hypothetical protein